MKTPKMFTEYEHPDPVIDFTGTESLARQEFRDESDINQIIKKYQATGFLVDPNLARSRTPMFGDFTNLPDFERSQQIVCEAQTRFDELPVELRKRFNYDPVELLRFLDDPTNKDEAAKLGLIENQPKAVSEHVSERSGSASAEPTETRSNGVTES